MILVAITVLEFRVVPALVRMLPPLAPRFGCLALV
jgi:hypothetical protein